MCTKRPRAPLVRRPQRRRPVGETRVAGNGELTHPPRALIQYPYSSGIPDCAEAPRYRQVTPIGRPRRILVLTFVRELRHHAILHAYRPHLEIPVLLLERDLIAVRRPFRSRSVAALSDDDGSNPSQPCA